MKGETASQQIQLNDKYSVVLSVGQLLHILTLYIAPGRACKSLQLEHYNDKNDRHPHNC